MKNVFLKRMTSILLSVCMTIPGTFMAGNIGTNVKVMAQIEGSVEENAADTVEAGAYDKQLISTLVKDNKFTASNSNISFVTDEKAKGVVISGKKTEMQSTLFNFTEEFNFDAGTVSRISIDALTQRSTKLTLAFYLDGNQEAFAAASLYRQKKANNWTYTKDISVDISDMKLTGKHTVSFKVLEADTDDVVFMLRSIEFVESSVPVVYFNIDESEGSIAAMNASADHTEECYGSMSLQVPDGYISEYSGKPAKSGTYEMEYIRGRGNSTWGTDKKPYKIKLDKKSDLLGMGKNKHWVLLANYYDNSLLRNKITYWLGKEMGLAYTPKSIAVDVVMNGEYYGSYFLCEHIRVGENRVEIDDLEDTEETKIATDPSIISGGYLLSMYPYGDEEKLSFNTKKEVGFLIESPSFEDYKNEAQYNYIKNYVQQVEDAIYGQGFKNSSGVSYTEFMDLDSAVDYYWMQEFSMNGDAFYSTSTYLYKPRNGKLFWGPLWDFDYVAWGSTEYEENYVQGWSQSYASWFERLFEDPVFSQKVVDRWPILKAKLTALTAQNGQLDKYAKELSISAKYNFEKWGMSQLGQEKDLTYTQEVERLRTWIHERIAWVDKHVQSLIPKECTITYVVDGKTVATQKDIVGKTFTKFPAEPKKKGYAFVGWYAEYTISFEEYLTEMGMTLDDMKEYYTEAEIKELLKKGIEYSDYIRLGDNIPGNIKLEAKFIPESEAISVKKVVLSQEKINSLVWSESFYLNVTVIPFDATNQDITWSSSNENVVIVENGLARIKGAGDVVITAQASNGVKTTCKVHIYSNEEMDNVGWVNDYELSDTDIQMKTGEYNQLKVSYYPEDGIFESDCSFMSTDESVVSVTDTGVLYAEGAGSAVIIVYNPYIDGIKICNVTVKESATNDKVKVGDKVTYKGIKYQVTGTGNSASVKCIGASKKIIKTVNIPKIIKIKGVSYKVTAINKGAFKKYKKLSKVTIEANVKSIGKEAFYGDAKLKSIKINSKSLKIEKNAFGKINKKAVIKVPKANLKSYKKKLKKFKVSAIKTTKKKTSKKTTAKK